jgi:hypothetical protein
VAGSRLLVPILAAIALFAAAPAYAQFPGGVVPPVGGQPPPPSGGDPEPDPPASEDPEPRQPVRASLSNERTRTRWAHALEKAVARKRPATDGEKVTRLRYDTEDGFPEVYLVLESYTDSRGRQWLKVRLPMRPNGRKGWVRRGALGKLHTVTTFLDIDKRRLRATLFRSGKRVWRAPVGVGKPGTETPGGRFYIRERIKVREKGSLYGPLAFGTSAYSRLTDWPGGGVVGIHGTNQPQLVPGRPSHGCVRVRNAAIVRLGRLMPIGTPLLIK